MAQELRMQFQHWGGPELSTTLYTVTQLIDLTSEPQEEAQDPDPQLHCNLDFKAI